jgi:cell division protein FtsN
MPHSHTADAARRSRWLIVVLVVGSVAAASLALGLLVVGPMLQHRMETPPPVLSASGTTAVASPRLSTAAADVEIKERIIPRPVPKPALPKSDELNIDLGQAPAAGDATSGLAGVAPAPPRSKPSIKATVTDAPGDPNGAVPDPGTATVPNASASRRGAAHSEDANQDSATRALAGGATGEPRPQAPSSAKARSHRSSPLDALPFLDSNGSSAGKELPAPSSASGLDAKGGKSYRVQVGRFSDERSAERLREELASTGLSPRVVRTQKGRTTVYRVQVGTYRQKENADRQMEALKSRSYEPYLADEEP